MSEVAIMDRELSKHISDVEIVEPSGIVFTRREPVSNAEIADFINGQSPAEKQEVQKTVESFLDQTPHVLEDTRADSGTGQHRTQDGSIRNNAPVHYREGRLADPHRAIKDVNTYVAAAYDTTARKTPTLRISYRGHTPLGMLMASGALFSIDGAAASFASQDPIAGLAYGALAAVSAWVARDALRHSRNHAYTFPSLNEIRISPDLLIGEIGETMLAHEVAHMYQPFNKLHMLSRFAGQAEGESIAIGTQFGIDAARVRRGPETYFGAFNQVARRNVTWHHHKSTPLTQRDVRRDPHTYGFWYAVSTGMLRLPGVDELREHMRVEEWET